MTSITNKTTCARFVLRSDCSTPACSNLESLARTFASLRIPAVSTSVNVPSGRVSVTSFELRVVCSTLLAMNRSSPTSPLSKDDFPTFGFPITATRIESSSPGSPTSSPSASRASCTRSSKSPVPTPCFAETAIGSLNGNVSQLFSNPS